MGTFDNLSETIANILDALALPRMVRRKLAKDPHYLYQQINYIVPLPYYDWNNPYTPRTVIHDIPAHIPCIFLHAQQDGMNPVAVAEDLSAQRAVIAPQRTHVWMPENSYLCSAMRYVGGVSLPHIEFPQLRSLPEANASLHHGIADREEAYTHQHLV